MPGGVEVDSSDIEQLNASRSTVGESPMIHPETLRIRTLYSKYVVSGSNARCVMMLNAFKRIIQDYVTPPHTRLNRTLENHLECQTRCISECRPLSVGMVNGVRYLKNEIAHIPYDMEEQEAKDYLCDTIDKYLNTKIECADKVIIQYVISKIVDNDVIMIYSRTDVVIQSLVEAQRMGKRFRVVLVDSAPIFRGRESAEILVDTGIDVTYIMVHTVGYMMRSVTKVLLGANGVYSNGTVVSQVGTCLVTMIAYDYRVPVIFCCETYKFVDKVQLESKFNVEHSKSSLESTYPEISKNAKKGSSKYPNLRFVTATQDITAPEYVTMIITEIGMIPCTSVPVVLREYCSFPF